MVAMMFLFLMRAIVKSLQLRWCNPTTFSTEAAHENGTKTPDNFLVTV
jgi:hypothetical protein